MLSQAAIEILRYIPRVKDNPYIIAGTKSGQPIPWPRSCWLSLMKIAKIEDFRMHDLRHEFATRALDLDMPEEMLQNLLGHASFKTTESYTHLLKLGMGKSHKTVDAIGTALGQRMLEQMADNDIIH